MFELPEIVVLSRQMNAVLAGKADPQGKPWQQPA